MATVPTPLDPIAGDVLSATAFDLGVRDPLLFLMDGYPRVHAWRGTALNSVDGTPTLVNFDSETFDTDNMHDPAVNPSRIKFPTAGLYEIDWLVTLATATYTALSLNIRLNAGGSAAGGTSVRTQPYMLGTGAPNLQLTFLRYMPAGDYLEAFVDQTSGGNRAMSATSLGTRCFARWIAIS